MSIHVTQIEDNSGNVLKDYVVTDTSLSHTTEPIDLRNSSGRRAILFVTNKSYESVSLEYSIDKTNWYLPYSRIGTSLGDIASMGVSQFVSLSSTDSQGMLAPYMRVKYAAKGSDVVTLSMWELHEELEK